MGWLLPHARVSVQVCVFVLLVFCAPWGTCSGAQASPGSAGVRRARFGRAEVIHGVGDEKTAAQAGAAVSHALSRIREDLGITFLDDVTIVIVRGRAQFDRACGRPMPRWAMAAALRGGRGRTGRMVVDAKCVTPATAGDLNLTLFHEAVHLALFSLEGERADRVPLWFHEGVAQCISGQSHLRGRRTSFNVAGAHGVLIPFDDLREGFPEDVGQAELAYVQSEAFVCHIVRTRSREALRWILDEYRRGAPFEMAFEKGLGLSRRQMEREWTRRRRSRFPWLRTVWEVTTITGVMALLTIVAFIAVRWRAWRQRRKWQREEAWEVLPADTEEEEPDEEDADDNGGHYMD